MPETVHVQVMEPISNNLPRLFTQAEAAKYLHTSERTLEDWRYGRGAGATLGFVKLGGKPLYPEAELIAFIERQMVRR